ncbi:protein kinase family protein [Streptomyces sp. ST2-7A]|uniref:protein kinase family protein n=1 Tax=Streptomyces sp. ST2-7A TaxID=2907214 RepID=UPI001F445DF0|nr:protein kinase family protein [Streptomyces sp. ST2-7A]MCE7081497.1 protein kinase family protein [Streptomyces sp. ST2-7A]
MKTAGEPAAGSTDSGGAAGPGGRGTARSRGPHGTRQHELHSGHRLVRRYRLEECITRLEGFSSWRAVDEKLRRAVGVHVLPARHPRAKAVLAAARSAALMADPRFVQVLDADEHDGLVQVIHEWLPDAVPVSSLLQAGPMDAHAARGMVGEVAEAMAASHAAGLAHLRLTPATVLRAGGGQFRIRGLAVDAALRGIASAHPARTDAESIGALLYAALTARWPYHEGAYGLLGVAGLGRGSRDPLATPEQVRAGVHRGLSDLAMRALVNDGATAASEQRPCTTPEEVVLALAAMPPIPAPEPEVVLLPDFSVPARSARGSVLAGERAVAAHDMVPPALPGRTGKVLKWGVAALVIAALGLGSWQIADALLEGDPPVESAAPQRPASGDTDEEEPPAGEDTEPGPVEIAGVIDFDPFGSGGSQNASAAPLAVDGDPETFWHTRNYFGPGFGNLKPGLGLVLDLGETRSVRSVEVAALGDHDIELRVAPAETETMPGSHNDYEAVAAGSGSSLSLTPDEPVETRYVLIWLTELPVGNDGNYRGRITNISVTG